MPKERFRLTPMVKALNKSLSQLTNLGELTCIVKYNLRLFLYLSNAVNPAGGHGGRLLSD